MGGKKQNVKNNNPTNFSKFNFQKKKRRIYFWVEMEMCVEDFFIQIFVVFLASVLLEQRTWN